MSVSREIELKLDLDPQSLKAVRDRCLKSVGSDQVARERLTSVYFDTKKLSLHRKGLSLRVRSRGEECIQTLKRREGGGGLFDRLEWNSEIAGDEPDLSNVDNCVFRSVLDAKRLRSRLRPVFTSEVVRTVWHIRSGGADIEVALDEGHVTAAGRSDSFAELELELKSGPRSELFEVARSLLPARGLKLGVLANSERGYALLTMGNPASFKSEPLFLERTISTEDAFKSIVRGCIRHFRINEALLIETRGPEPLHQCRVALRRLRTAISLFKDVIADEEVKHLKSRLRSLSQKLGEVRDLDVFLGKLEEPHDGNAEMTLVNEEVLERARNDREQACDRVIGALRRKRSKPLMFDILAWSEAGPWLSIVDQTALARRREPIESFAADVLDRRSRKIRKRGRNLEDLDPPARHDVRIEAKKLRYATEFFSSLAITKKHRRRHESFSTALVSFQEHLGELNDVATGDNLARNAAQRAGSASTEGGRPGRDRAARRSMKAATSAFREIAKAKPFWGSRSSSESKG